MAVLAPKRDRHAAIRRLVADRSIGSQSELVDALSALGFEVTQATVSRDIAELGLAKVMRGDRSIYVNPEALIADGTISGGMVPKVAAALAALAWDDAEAIIADGSAPDALVRALGDPTFGTRVSARARAGAA